jgi:ABC-type hemin transport system ATPase subunit
VEGAAVAWGRTIWQNVDPLVQPGEFLAILGPNGAGHFLLLPVTSECLEFFLQHLKSEMSSTTVGVV